jgi:A49-like RNA polymerase I associated factor
LLEDHEPSVMSTQARIQVEASSSSSSSSSSCCCVANFPGGLPSSLRRTTEERGRTLQNGGGGGGDPNDVPRFAVRDTSKKGKSGGVSRSKGASGAEPATSLVVVGKDSTCHYAGNVVDASRSRMCVGVYDKHTSTLTLYPAATASLQQSVIRYQPRASNGSAAASAAASASSSSGGAAGVPVAMKTLVGEFGSVKKQRAYKSQEANRVHLENVVGSTVEQFLDRTGGSNKKKKAGAGGDDADAPIDPVERVTREWRQAFLPPFDEGATDPLRVYNMEEFAGRDAWRLVGHRATALFQNKDQIRNATAAPDSTGPGTTANTKGGDANSYLSGALASLRRLLLQQHTDSKLYQIKCALLYQHLANLYLLLHRRKFIPPIDSNKPAYFGAPNEVAQLFLDKFTTSIQNSGRDGHALSKANHDKCRAHLLLLHVASHDCSQAPIAAAAADLKLDLAVASHLLKLAGCTVDKKRTGAGKTSSNEPVATLALPLTFPKATGVRKRKAYQ